MLVKVRRLHMIIAIGLICAGTAAVASAESITIFNTGVDNNGVALSGGSVDGHYSLVSSSDAGFPGPAAKVAHGNSNNPFPPNWITPASDSKWISPRGVSAVGNSSGEYIYETTFDLTGLDPSTAELSGIWGADNEGEIYLNGVDTGEGTSDGQFGFEVLTAFSLTSGFIAGENVLEFYVDNVPNAGNPNPTGLDVQISGTADAPSVPEPNTVLLLVGALATVGWRVRGRVRAAR